MGLRQSDRITNSRAGHSALTSHRHWQVCATVGLVSLLIAFSGETGREWMRYDRLAIADGDFWRVLTGHFAHLGPSHFVLNMAGLLLTWLLVGSYFCRWQWWLIVAVSALGISAGFWFVDRDMLWYVGLSGVLHALLAAGALRGLTIAPVESAILLALVVVKLSYEQFFGAVPGSHALSGGNVIVNAHLYGAILGLIVAALLKRSTSTGARI